jgi:hypothetical protein
MSRYGWSTDSPPPPRPWHKLPPIRGFTRIPDGPGGQRRCRCDGCGWEGPTLGTGLHMMSAEAHQLAEREGQ